MSRLAALRSRAAPVGLASVGLALTAPLSSAAQDADPIASAVAAYVQPSNAERLSVLTAQLEVAGLDYQIETFEGGNDRTGPTRGSNVVVVIGDSEREILLTGHYDAVVLADGGLADGVVDNAASVVAMIEAAKALKTRALDHRIRIIFTDQEELGLIGARRWIEAHGLDNVAAVVNSDIAAYGDTLMHGLNNGPQSVEVTQAVLRVCAQRVMACVGFPQYPPSDDRAFSAAGAPVVSVGFQDGPAVHQIWLTMNGGAANGLAPGFVPRVFEVIHSPGDTIDVVEPATIRLAAEVYVDVLTELDLRLSATGN
jgi:Zn-dependent M28 family amino/carboxypeptidase